MIESLLFYSSIIIKKEEKPFIVQTTKFGLHEIGEIVRTFIEQAPAFVKILKKSAILYKCKRNHLFKAAGKI